VIGEAQRGRSLEGVDRGVGRVLYGEQVDVGGVTCGRPSDEEGLAAFQYPVRGLAAVEDPGDPTTMKMQSQQFAGGDTGRFGSVSRSVLLGVEITTRSFRGLGGHPGSVSYVQM